MALDMTQEKQYELALLALTHKYLGKQGLNYLKFKPINYLGVENFYNKPYIAQVDPYKTKAVINNNSNKAMVNLTDPNFVNQITKSTVGEVIVDNYNMDVNANININVNLNVDFKIRFLAYVEQVLAMAEAEEKEKMAGAYATTVLDMCEDEVMQEDFALNTIEEAFPEAASEVNLEEVKKQKATLKEKLLAMKNKFLATVEEAKAYIKSEKFEEDVQKIKEETLEKVNNAKKYLTEKSEDIKEKLTPTVNNLKVYVKKSKDRMVEMSNGVSKNSKKAFKNTKEAFILAGKGAIKAAKRIVAFVPKVVETVADTTINTAKKVKQTTNDFANNIKGLELKF